MITMSECMYTNRHASVLNRVRVACIFDCINMPVMSIIVIVQGIFTLRPPELEFHSDRRLL